MDSNKILLGGNIENNGVYGIISIKREFVIKTGKMSTARDGYCFEKIKNKYYAILGQNGSFGCYYSVDVFDFKTEQWEL